MITFLTSMRPKRSMRIGSLPVTTVSPTAPNSGPRPLLSHGRVSALDDEAQDVGAVQAVGREVLEGEPFGLLRLEQARQVDEERIGAQPGEDAHAVAAPAVLVVDAEVNLLARRRHQPAVLHGRRAIAVGPRRLEVAGEHQLLVGAGEGERRRRPAAGDGDRPQPEAAVDRVREGRVGLGQGLHVQHEDEVARPLGAGERVEIGDVAGRAGERSGAGEMVRHGLSPP